MKFVTSFFKENFVPKIVALILVLRGLLEVADPVGAIYEKSKIGIPLDEAISSEINTVVIKLAFYLIGLLVLALIWAVLDRMNFTTIFRYQFWIRNILPKVLPLLQAIGMVDPMASKRLEQIEDSRRSSPRNLMMPAFVYRRDLDRRHYWPDWNFSAVTILDRNKITQEMVSEKKWQLNVDLRGEEYGIYSSAGKAFLEKTFGEEAQTPEVGHLEEQFHRYMFPDGTLKKKISWSTGTPVPLRWASGGYLPIVKYKNKYWAQFFFRDVTPIGLNIANGASEANKEHRDLKNLIKREFAEETILLTAAPQAGREVGSVTFKLDIQSAETRFENIPFARRHAELRKLHDNLDIFPEKRNVREVRPIYTPFTVSVTVGDNPRDTQQISNVIYSVNPKEFGVEVVWICTFEMNEGEYLIDGEYNIFRDVLIRQPVILLEMDFLKSVYIQTKSLGSISSNQDAKGGKILPPIPAESFYFFDAEIKLKQARLEELQKLALLSSLTDDEKENIDYEANKRLLKWLDQYALNFSEARKGVITFDRFRTLCPVSWKALELIFAHNINYKVI